MTKVFIVLQTNTLVGRKNAFCTIAQNTLFLLLEVKFCAKLVPLLNFLSGLHNNFQVKDECVYYVGYEHLALEKALVLQTNILLLETNAFKPCVRSTATHTATCDYQTDLLSTWSLGHRSE